MARPASWEGHKKAACRRDVNTGELGNRGQGHHQENAAVINKRRATLNRNDSGGVNENSDYF